ncbi:MAG: cyclic pyranopterin monophosphate synthase MoaC [Ahniella sp.]|nr:cyclic pyranopterin monophosphate synthase MoaC [Ahniella sp.]
MQTPGFELSHVGADDRPGMVDVGGKTITKRSATAESFVTFPEDAAQALHDAGLQSKKGPVIDTAIIAGTMAVKRCAELIPFCHPLPIQSIRFDTTFVSPGLLRIRCTVAAEARTGVEMEALTGASLAALTVYDMCKSLSLGLIIGPTQVIEKSGGKRDFSGDTAP